MNSIEPKTPLALAPPRIAIGLAAAFACSLTYAQTPGPTTDQATQDPATESAAPAQDPLTQESAPAAKPVSEEKIGQFAEAYIQVETIQTQAAEQLSSATDAESANAVKVNTETEMIQAVERSGLQVEEFNEIVQAMNVDPQLRTRVLEKIEERRGT